MALVDYIPYRAPKFTLGVDEVLNPEDQKQLSGLVRVAALALGKNHALSSIAPSRRRQFETPDHDYGYINNVIDVDGYARQATAKYQELFWKEGWQIVSENPEAIDYLWERIDYLEVAMNRTFQDFLGDVADQLIRFSNVFVAKARADIEPFYPGKLRAPEGRMPLAGYYIIPTETVEIQRTRTNKPLKYRQNTSLAEHPHASSRMPTWKAEDVIHIYLDRKPGRAFGTPMIISATEDLSSLRQMEEDVLNLVHRELFPTWQYKVGTDDRPADRADIEAAKLDMESMRTEGGLVTPHHHEVTPLAGGESVLDAGPYLTHFKERVAIGLGVYPHHLGMMMEGGNRSATDRLDAALFDKVKQRQRQYADSIRFFIFNELLWEGGFDPFINPKITSQSDRCVFKFNEIDVDTQVKKETHIIQKYASNLLTTDEARLELNMKPGMDESETFVALTARMMPDQPQTNAQTGGSSLVDTTPASAKQAPSTGGKPNAPNVRKGASNIIRPANQTGTRTSPNIRRSDDYYDMLENAKEMLDDEDDSIF